MYICTQSCNKYVISYRAIYRPISGDLSADISNIGLFLLQTIWRTISLYRICSRQKRKYRTISRLTRSIFKTGAKILQKYAFFLVDVQQEVRWIRWFLLGFQGLI